MAHTEEMELQQARSSRVDGEWARVECAELIQRLSARKPAQDRYVHLGEVGRGGMGRVLRVRDEDLHRDLAMKVMRDEDVLGSSAAGEAVSQRMVQSARFIEEAQVAGQLDHPGIVPIHDVGLDRDGRLFFTMKLVRGRTLEKVLELARGGLEGWSTTRVLSVLLRVCESMSYAHQRGVLHRDLKPSNIMIGHHGEVYVMDWGLARLIGRQARARAGETDSADLYSARHGSPGQGSSSPFVTEDGRILGTPAYMSPEQARGEPAAARTTTDVYGVGAMLYQALTGIAPYAQPGRALDNQAVWVALQSKPPRPIAEIAPRTPPELVSICERAMARSVDERYPSMTELGEDLRAYLELRTVRAHRTGPVVELRKWISRNKSVASLAGLVIALITAGSLAIALVEQRRADDAQMRADSHRAALLVAEFPKLSPLPEEHVARADWLFDARELVATASQRKARLQAFEADALASGRAVSRPSPPDVDLENRILNSRNSVRGIGVALDKARGFVVNEKTTPTDEQDALDALAILPAELAWFQAEVERLEGLRSPAATLEFVDRDEQLHRAELSSLAGALDVLARDGIPAVEALEQRSREMSRRSTGSAEAALAWAAATASIADRGQCPMYAGLVMEPQSGLLPLRRDPASGLWEFWHVLSGEKPTVREAGGYAMDASSAIVLVLVPGGQVTAGAQAKSPDGQRFDPDARKSEQLRIARLDPYFLSKHEMTQGQWLRLTGGKPSEWLSGMSTPEERRVSRAHPVEQVTWLEGQGQLARWGLTLPTELQFEHAARAGTSNVYGAKSSFDALVEQVNYADKRFHDRLKLEAPKPTHDDGFLYHAPVGSFAPNGFGLYDVFGNVAEWCRDWYADGCDRTPPRDGDGEVHPLDLRERVFRGGGFRAAPEELRASRRQKLRPDRGMDELGLRPARQLDARTIGP